MPAASPSLFDLLKLIWATLVESAVVAFAYKKGAYDAAIESRAETAEAQTSALQMHLEHATANADLSDDDALGKLRSRFIPDAEGH